METFESIRARRSVRAYLDIPVEVEKIGNILEAGRLAPCAGNSQNTRFILVTDEKKREEIGALCLEQYWVGSAPLIIVVCSYVERARRLYQEEGERFAIMGASAAIENMLLAAQDQGLGSCWVGAYDSARLKALLEIPEDVLICAVLPIGYPDKVPSMPNKLNIEDITYSESWGNRISDIAAYMQWYGEHVQKAARKVKRLVSDFARRLQQ
ncbi:nitroreductase family protein [Candidatus Woesearchaeota archaeon]|nr:MAG: nitroreductase family protein [Candidatus Woesearchaeota archaeon]